MSDSAVLRSLKYVCSIAAFAAVSAAYPTSVSVATASSPPNGVKVVVSAAEPAAEAALVDAGATLVADRGGYRVYALAPSRARSGGSIPGVVVREDFDRIALRRRTIATGGAALRGGAAVATSPRRLKLVQFSAPPSEADLEAIAEVGARVVHYVPQNAYIVWTDDVAGAEALRARTVSHSAFQYYGDYRADDALAPTLDARLGDAATVEVSVQLFDHGPAAESDLKTIVKKAAAVIDEPVSALAGRYLNLRVSLAGTQLAAIAALDSVVNVEPYVRPVLLGERQDQILAGNLDAAQQSPSAPGYLAWLAANGFSTAAADYPIVVVVDDGVDDGTATPSTEELYELGSSANPSRLDFSVIPPGSSASGPEGPDGHGHINASIVGGYNDLTGAADEDAGGFNYGLGISPYGRLANVRIFAPGFDVGTGDATMVDDYYTRGARISTNSWGADVFGAYTVDAQLYDSLTRDAQSSVGGNQEMLFIFAAGNAGPIDGSVGSPGTAKNVLTVGASETSNPDAAGGDGCGSSSTEGDDARDMAGFSSRGPCTDARIKPEIVAPGTFIQGNASQPVFNGSGVCGASGNDFAAPGTDALFPPGSIYTWSSGTSHSTPAIAGYTSLVSEFLARTYSLATPSAALIKAYVVHSGRHLTGSGANEDLPGKNQGFGIADMGFAFDTTSLRHFEDQGAILAGPGESFVLSGQAPDPAEPIRVALVWTDAPGATVGDAFVNDLDLVVEVGGDTYLGNNFSAGVSVTGGAADTRNNSEAVFLPAGASGPMTITVNATTIAGDGVPGNADVTDQDFALVAYNFALALPAGTIVLDAPAYACSDIVGIAVADSDLTGDGTLAVTVTTSGGDSENVTLTETPAGSGLFVGTTITATGSVVPGDAAVQVADGETITATYLDADDGTGSPAAVQAVASVDCVAPVVSGVGVAGVTGSAATVDFSSDEAATGSVRYGTSCAALTMTTEGAAGQTSHSIVLAGLDSLTTYFVAADAIDDAGNVGSDDNGGLCYSFTTLEQIDFLTEEFADEDNDLENKTFTFTPSGSGSFYDVCSQSAVAFPTDPGGGEIINLADDDFAEIAVGDGEQVSLYGIGYSSVFVNSNGSLTFGAGDTDFSESLAEHFSLPRVAPLYDDLDPSVGASGDISWRQLSNRLVVTYDDVPEFGTGNENTFQVELFFNGVVRITALRIDASDGIVGLSDGAGPAPAFEESSFDAFDECVVLPLCPAAPIAGCNDAGKASLQLKDSATSPAKDKLQWKWAKGAETLIGEFGDPRALTHIAACIYDGLSGSEALVGELLLPANGLWKEKAGSLKFQDPTAAADGIVKVQLKPGIAGKPRLQVKARAANLSAALPGPFDASSYFDSDPSVTVQLLASDTGICWTSTFPLADARKNTVEQYNAKSP